MDNPLGGIKRGWQDIQQTYERLFSSRWRYSFEFWDYTIHSAGQVFWAVGRERGRLISDGELIDLVIRTSRIFRIADGRWRQVHHHGSIDDPQMLSRYLEAVREQ
jgi:ketosteroid isomerase-like protein